MQQIKHEIEQADLPSGIYGGAGVNLLPRADRTGNGAVGSKTPQ